MSLGVLLSLNLKYLFVTLELKFVTGLFLTLNRIRLLFLGQVQNTGHRSQVIVLPIRYKH